MSERQLVLGDFSGLIGQVFTLEETDFPPIALTLKAAEPLVNRGQRPDFRPPFSLTFLAQDPRILEQRMYRLANATMGSVSLFLVPTGKDDRGVFYDSTFN